MAAVAPDYDREFSLMKDVTPVSIATPDNITSALKNNLRGVVSWAEGVPGFCSVNGGTVTVTHSLGKMPNRIDVEPNVDGNWWLDDDDKGTWDETSVTFHASAVGRYTVFVGRV